VDQAGLLGTWVQRWRKLHERSTLLGQAELLLVLAPCNFWHRSMWLIWHGPLGKRCPLGRKNCRGIYLTRKLEASPGMWRKDLAKWPHEIQRTDYRWLKWLTIAGHTSCRLCTLLQRLLTSKYHSITRFLHQSVPRFWSSFTTFIWHERQMKWLSTILYWKSNDCFPNARIESISIVVLFIPSNVAKVAEHKRTSVVEVSHLPWYDSLYRFSGIAR
jgi:hypothetical protein